MKYLVVNATFPPAEESWPAIARTNGILRRIPESQFFSGYHQALNAVQPEIPDLAGIAMSFTPLSMLTPLDRALADEAAPEEGLLISALNEQRLRETLQQYVVALLTIRRFAIRATGRRLVIYSGASLGRELRTALEVWISIYFPGFVWLAKKNPATDVDTIIAALAGDSHVKSDW